MRLFAAQCAATTSTDRYLSSQLSKNKTGGTARRVNHGGADRDRTDDLLVANQTLSQLSYSPIASAVGTSPDESWA